MFRNIALKLDCPYRRSSWYLFVSYLKSFFTIKIFTAFCCFTFVYTMFLSIDRPTVITTEEDLIQEVIDNVGQDIRYANMFRKKEKLLKDIKFILLWGSKKVAPFYFYGEGEKAFIMNNCSYVNCFVTDDKHFLNNIGQFDVIAFNGRQLSKNRDSFPPERAPNQRYVYFNMESADNFPVCDKMYDNFFNWTATYRLDSDIPTPYIQIKNLNDVKVGPKRDMQWQIYGTYNDEDLDERWRSKTKAAAWFVSHCKIRSNRTKVAKELRKAMLPYNMKLYIFGRCGTNKCPKSNNEYCYNMLQKEFFFYLAFENSFSEDYVTEKVLTALQYGVVPIVLGGANYSRFLPPGSYLDASSHTPEELAATMHAVIHSSRLYQNYFKWRNHYVYNNPHQGNKYAPVCDLCQTLNEKSKMETTKAYRDFRRWWNPNYEERCKNKNVVKIE